MLMIVDMQQSVIENVLLDSIKYGRNGGEWAGNIMSTIQTT